MHVQHYKACVILKTKRSVRLKTRVYSKYYSKVLTFSLFFHMTGNMMYACILNNHPFTEWTDQLFTNSVNQLINQSIIRTLVNQSTHQSTSQTDNQISIAVINLLINQPITQVWTNIPTTHKMNHLSSSNQMAYNVHYVYTNIINNNNKTLVNNNQTRESFTHCHWQ